MVLEGLLILCLAVLNYSPNVLFAVAVAFAAPDIGGTKLKLLLPIIKVDSCLRVEFL